MKRSLLFAILILLACGAAQAKTTGPIVEANWDLATKWGPLKIYELTRTHKVYPNWLPERETFWYRFLTSEGRFYWLIDPDAGNKEPLFDGPTLAAELTRLTGEVHDGLDIDLTEFTFADNYRHLEFELSGVRYLYDRHQSQLAVVDSVSATDTGPALEEWQKLSPDGTKYVFCRANNLFLGRLDQGVEQAVQLTSDGATGLSWGSTWELIAGSDTTRHGMDVAWSPDSRRFCLKRADVRQVADLWLVDHLAQPRPTLKTYKCPPAGGKVPQWELWIGDSETQAMVKVDSDRWPDQTLDDLFDVNTWWRPDSQALFFTRRHRDYMQLDVCAADPATGATMVLIEERLNGMVYTRTPTPLPETGEALWWSMRDGWGHLYLYGMDGSLKRQLTSGDWMVDEVVAVQDGVVFFTGLGREPKRNPYSRYLYRVNLDGSNLQLLTPEDAEHDVVMSPANTYLIDRFSRPDLPTRTVIRDTDGNLLLTLEEAKIDLLTDAGWQPPEVFHVPGADGQTEQWGVIYKPFDFDPARKYPIVTRVYPGRQGEFVPRDFDPVNVETALAQLGVIVVRFGNRGGTPERGLAYREYGRDELRDYGLADKKVVIENLAAQHSWIDLDRVGIFGGSSGGFMTVSAMLVYPEFFKVGVAMTSPNEPTLYYNHWVERYAGVEQVTGADGAVSWSATADGNIELAENLAGRLLMINGGQDDNTHPLHLFRMADAFIQAGKLFDMFVVPGAGHGLGSWQYTYGLTFDYFAAHLLGDRRDSVQGLFLGQ